MKITKERLQEIIKEEISSHLISEYDNNDYPVRLLRKVISDAFGDALVIIKVNGEEREIREIGIGKESGNLIIEV